VPRSASFRSAAALAAVVLAGCTAIDDFSKFVVGDGGSSSDGGGDAGCIYSCNGDTLVSSCGTSRSCTCIDADSARGIPAHCAPSPPNIGGCSRLTRRPTLILDNASYRIDTTNNSVLRDNVEIARTEPIAVMGLKRLCVESITMAPNARPTIDINGTFGLLILADSIIDLDGRVLLVGRQGGPGPVAGGGGPGGGAGGSGGTNAMSASMFIGAGGQGGGAETASGGGGGGNAIAGGNGGVPQGTSNVGTGGSATTNWVSGGGGGGGGAPSASAGGGGGGGGALYLAAGYEVRIRGDIVAVGGPGAGGAVGTGGGGGGAGGLIVVDAPSVSLEPYDGTHCLSVHGGAGGNGGNGSGPGASGTYANSCPYRGVPGMAARDAGGLGGTPEASPNGTFGSGTGGGAAGGTGRVIIRSSVPPPANVTQSIAPPSAYSYTAP
jgi:hypothetical protein